MVIGRPRQFDVDAAVETALPIFLEKGYEGATFGELVAAMGIKPPSFYAAFGSKEGLFRQVLALYLKQGQPIVTAALAQETALGVVESLLRSSADAHTNPSKPGGCLLVQSALSCSGKATAIRDDVAEKRVAIEPILQDRFEMAIKLSDHSIGAAPAKAARFVSTVIQGMAVQAAGGATREDLHSVVDVALAGIANSLTSGRSRISTKD